VEKWQRKVFGITSIKKEKEAESQENQEVKEHLRLQLLEEAGVAAYRRANPGSKLKTAVTGKVKPGSKAANRRKSYCARSAGQLRRSSAKTRNDPNSRIRQARRRWKC